MISKRKKILRWLLLLLWLAVIFIMSQQPGDKSSSQSDFVVKSNFLYRNRGKGFF